MTWTFASNSQGYMLFKDGVAQGGAKTLGTAIHTSDGRRRSWQARQADVKMHHDTAERICAQRNQEENVKIKAEKFLAAYDPLGMVTLSDVYDEDEDLRIAIAQLMPEFEYPNWSHLPVRDLWRHIEKEGGTK